MSKQRGILRRDLLEALALMFVALPVTRTLASAAGTAVGNFRYIYADPVLRAEFKQFLVNVFHLFPEDSLHALILKNVDQGLSDAETYRQVQSHLSDIKPFLGDLRLSLPTLSKQKQVLTEQTLSLLDTDRRYDGYLEVGSNGRFLDYLEENLDIKGDRFTMSDQAPSNSVIDIIDRGQFSDAGQFISLSDYQPAISTMIPKHSLDLVTVYIGFHHCPVSLRMQFLSQIREVLRPGGVLIVRDHDAHDEKMTRMVALAHDVFNMGTQQTWDYNARERRNFYSLDAFNQLMTVAGFKTAGRRLLQHGDPTLNTLMRFTVA